ncbi:hypothetical protein Pcinc_041922 [Petrolisthes cinctipes]|uniref:Uncharacterized protein n=1 Tax=Petrolisthes cinctipes TaxID=88211 RepID=A0AAE1EGI7_PETCI|nr:hypothetical protein Pcinc_041922 [Petrolisthes cinctipes]
MANRGKGSGSGARPRASHDGGNNNTNTRRSTFSLLLNDLARRRLARNASAVGGGPAGMDGARTGQSGLVVTEEAPPGPLNL